ncbi:MAG: hypothetical protein M1416_01970 [Candidatus Pacearchaeota archaeon]|nr:hypothetical protein [Candidatus Pacearchaeota archaeon]
MINNKRGQNESFSLCNFFSKNRRGLSTIVVTMIIILLSIIAIGIIWFVVSNIISEGSGQVRFGQFLIDLDITNAYEENGNIFVDVTRKVGAGELLKIKFVLSDEVNSELIEAESSLGELESNRFSLDPSNLIASQVTTVSVAPVFKSDEGEEVTSEVTDTYSIGVTIDEDCVPDCSALECGEDPECGEECGPCTGTDTCTNGVCVPEDCEPETQEITCGTWVCGTKINNCGAEINCGECGGQFCREGACVDITPVNSGKVEETWPGTSGLYFGSTDFPINVSYENYYIEFLNSDETDCLLIAVYKFPVQGYSKSHVGFNFETSIQTDDDYQIWETIEECQS